MARKPISITLDEAMIERVDRLAEIGQTTRTAVIERAIRNDLPEQEALLRQLENPVLRELHKRITSSPAVLRVVAALVREDLTDEDIQRLIKRGPVLREAARKQKIERKKQSYRKDSDKDVNEERAR